MFVTILLTLLLLGWLLWRAATTAPTPEPAWPSPPPPPGAPECLQVDLTKTEAEQLLDWLELQGAQGLRVGLSASGFSVAWRGGPPEMPTVQSLRVRQSEPPPSARR